MLKLIATATFGLESVASREIGALGYEARVVRPGWLAFEGDELAIARANLWLRTSDRVLLELGSFTATDFGALFDQTASIAWERFVPRNARFPVRGRSVKSRLASVPACQRIVKRAIAERLLKAHAVRNLPEDGPSYPVEVALFEDEASLALDTTGVGLHKRGYRPGAGEAPLKETLAAGLVLLSFWNRERPFLDPFCGTGTLPIEAALIGRNRAPGLARSFTAESWPALPAGTWRRAREEARDLEAPPLEPPIVGSDADANALFLARRNAERSGIGGDIRFEQADFTDIASDRSHGCLITNPPYAERMGETERIRELYRAMPEVFRRFPTWSFYVLTSWRDFEALVGREADRRRKLYNGRIECTYFQFFGPRPGEKALRQAFGGLDDKARRQGEIFGNRLRKRARHLRRWPERRGTDAYRIYERDIKEVPLVVDRFGVCYRVAPLDEAITKRSRAEHADWLDLMVRTACESLEAPPENVFVHGRRREPRHVQVRENGLLFEVVLSGENSPDLEIGYREIRRRIRELAPGKRFLGLSSNASSFGIAAAAGGAAKTTNVEPPGKDLGRAKRSFTSNGLDVDEHRFVRSGITEFLERDDGGYDLAAFEASAIPPSPRAWDRLFQLMAPSSTLILVTRNRRFQLDEKTFAGWDAEEITERTIPEEFRNHKLHRAWELTKPA